MQPELVVLRVEGEQTLDEDSDLWSGEMLAVANGGDDGEGGASKGRNRLGSGWRREGTCVGTHAWRFVKAFCNKVPTKLMRNSRFEVPACAWSG